MAPDRYVTLSEVRHLLTKTARERELSPEQKTAQEHAQRFGGLDMETVKKLTRELMSEASVSEAQTAKIIDLLPQTPDEVRLVFTKERSGPDKKQIDQILEIIRKYM
ncbi:MAG: hypothetical protein QXP70_04540 [Methanomassiliicoccales archaeon]